MKAYRYVGILVVVLLVLTGCQFWGEQTAAPAGTTAPATTAATTPAGVSHFQLQPTLDGTALELLVDDVQRFYAIDVELNFDPTKMQVRDIEPATLGVQIRPGQAPAPDFVAKNEVDNQTGKIRYVVTQIAPRTGFNGRGLVATVVWQGEFDPTAIAITQVTLVNEDGQPIAVATVGVP